VKELFLDQGDPNVDGLRLPAITGPQESQRNALTSLSELNQQDIIVTTRLVSAFFQDVTKTVKAHGLIVLDFKDTAARMRRRTLEISAPLRRGLQVGSGEQEFVIDNIAVTYASEDPDTMASGAAKISCFFIFLLGLTLKELWY